MKKYFEKSLNTIRKRRASWSCFSSSCFANVAAFISSVFQFISLKGIKDKNSVAYFWLLSFLILFAADFQANHTDIS